MRNFNMLAAVSAALLMSGGVFSKEKPGPAKPKKICRDVPSSDIPAAGDHRKAGDPREADNSRD